MLSGSGHDFYKRADAIAFTVVVYLFYFFLFLFFFEELTVEAKFDWNFRLPVQIFGNRLKINFDVALLNSMSCGSLH